MPPRKGANMNPKSINNLKPIAKGEVKNPYGRKGKDGKGGLSLKNEFKRFIENMEEADRDAVWAGLWMRATTGDVSAIKLFVELNDEKIVSDAPPATDNGPKIIIQIPEIEKPNE